MQLSVKWQILPLIVLPHTLKNNYKTVLCPPRSWNKQPLYLSVKKAETEPGQDAKPPCPSTDLPSISGQGMDFQREPECMHLSKGSYCLLGVHFLCLFHQILNRQHQSCLCTFLITVNNGNTLSTVCSYYSDLCVSYCRRELFTAVHKFVHLNLAIALFVGYLTFAVGVELATSNKV